MIEGDDFLTEDQERTLATMLTLLWQQDNKEAFTEVATVLSMQLSIERVERLIEADKLGQLQWVVEYWSVPLEQGDAHPDFFSSCHDALEAAKRDFHLHEWAKYFSLRATEAYRA